MLLYPRGCVMVSYEAVLDALSKAEAEIKKIMEQATLPSEKHVYKLTHGIVHLLIEFYEELGDRGINAGLWEIVDEMDKTVHQLDQAIGDWDAELEEASVSGQ